MSALKCAISKIVKMKGGGELFMQVFPKWNTLELCKRITRLAGKRFRCGSLCRVTEPILRKYVSVVSLKYQFYAFPEKPSSIGLIQCFPRFTRKASDMNPKSQGAGSGLVQGVFGCRCCNAISSIRFLDPGTYDSAETSKLRKPGSATYG
jgi:hypothetical protein